MEIAQSFPAVFNSSPIFVPYEMLSVQSPGRKQLSHASHLSPASVVPTDDQLRPSLTDHSRGCLTITSPASRSLTATASNRSPAAKMWT